MADLTSAALEGGRLEILVALRARLILGIEEASAGVIPQYAKQIADLTREIDELQPSAEEVSDIAGFAEDFNAEIEQPKPKSTRKK